LALVQSKVTITRSLFLNTTAAGEGGAIHAVGSSLNLVGTTFKSTFAPAMGAAIKFDEGAFEAIGCQFEDTRGNSALYAVLVSSFRMVSCHFLRCSGGAQSGALSLVQNGATKPVQAYLENATFASCQGSRSGGALYAESTEGELPVLLLKDSLFTGCKVVSFWVRGWFFWGVGFFC
jgi:hypothetical protein